MRELCVGAQSKRVSCTGYRARVEERGRNSKTQLSAVEFSGRRLGSMADLRLLDLPPVYILNSWLPARKGATSAAIYPKLCGWLRAASLTSQGQGPAPVAGNNTNTSSELQPNVTPDSSTTDPLSQRTPVASDGTRAQTASGLENNRSGSKEKVHPPPTPRYTLQCYTDPSQSLILLLRPASRPPTDEPIDQKPQPNSPKGRRDHDKGRNDSTPKGNGGIDKDWSDSPPGGGVTSAVLWVEEGNSVDVKTVVEKIVDQFGNNARFLFSPIDRRHLPHLESAAKVTAYPEVYNVWMADRVPAPLEQREIEALAAQGLVLDTLKDEDIESVLEHSTVPFSRKYIEELVNAPPFHTLTCAVRESATGTPVSWAITHNDYAIGSVATVSEQRGKGLGVLVVRELARKQLKAGQPAAFAYIALDNTSSQRLFQKAGFACRQDREFLWCIADQKTF